MIQIKKKTIYKSLHLANTFFNPSKSAMPPNLNKHLLQLDWIMHKKCKNNVKSKNNH